MDPQSNSESRSLDVRNSRFDPNNPFEDIYRIDIEPNMFITDSKPPSYNEVLENNKDLNKPPPSYLESLEFGKFPLYIWW